MFRRIGLLRPASAGAALLPRAALLSGDAQPTHPQQQLHDGVVPAVACGAQQRRFLKFNPKHPPKHGDWVCAKCDENNFQRNRHCFKCSAPCEVRLVGPRDPVPRTGDWVCPNCWTNNFSKNSSCFSCHASRIESRGAKSAALRGVMPPKERKRPRPSAPGSWRCAECSANNFADRGECHFCSAPKQPPKKEAAWQCSNCESHNFADSGKCHKCHASKEASFFPLPKETKKNPAGKQETTQEEKLSFSEIRQRAQWQCTHCKAPNFAERVTCRSCLIPNAALKKLREQHERAKKVAGLGVEKEDDADVAKNGTPPQEPKKKREMRRGDWICKKCGAHNYNYKIQCHRCKEPHAVMGGQQQQQNEQKRRKADNVEVAKNNVQVGRVLRRSPPPPSANAAKHPDPSVLRAIRNQKQKEGDPQEKKKVDWVCNMCATRNLSHMNRCHVCDSAPPHRRRDLATRSATPHKILPGDWVCPRCNVHNFASRKDCHKCSEVPLLEPGDWICPACDAQNYGRNFRCFKCDGPKPHIAKIRRLRENLTSTPSTSTTPSATPQKGSWLCACGWNNFASRTHCMKCAVPRVGGIPGDWTCACGKSNFGSSSECTRCAAANPKRQKAQQ